MAVINEKSTLEIIEEIKVVHEEFIERNNDKDWLYTRLTNFLDENAGNRFADDLALALMRKAREVK